MSWQPNCDADAARARASMLSAVRDWFDSNGVLEVSTPTIVSSGVTDPAIDSLAVAAGDRRGWLHTSPEFFMKRLLAAGYPDIYQVGPVFRGGEAGRHHLPEFTLVEWYRHGFDLSNIIGDTLELAEVLFDGMNLDEPLIVDYAELFDEQLGLDALSAEPTTLADAFDADEDLRRSVGDDRDAWLDLAMATRIANHFDQHRLTVVRHYPASQASLARLNPEDRRVADRFELYLGSVELANGFVELTDPDEQLRRFEYDRLKRRSQGLPDMPVDDALIDALRSGLPECAGVALGLDRALMIAGGHDKIEDVITFSPGLI